MMRNRFIFLVLLVLLFSVLSYGQSYRSFSATLDEIENRTLWKTGPFRFFPLLGVRDLGYDSNVYYMPEALDPVSDYMAVVYADLNAHIVYKKRLILSLRWIPEYVYYYSISKRRYL